MQLRWSSTSSQDLVGLYFACNLNAFFMHFPSFSLHLDSTGFIGAPMGFDWILMLLCVEVNLIRCKGAVRSDRTVGFDWQGVCCGERSLFSLRCTDVGQIAWRSGLFV